VSKNNEILHLECTLVIRDLMSQLADMSAKVETLQGWQQDYKNCITTLEEENAALREECAEFIEAHREESAELEQEIIDKETKSLYHDNMLVYRVGALEEQVEKLTDQLLNLGIWEPVDQPVEDKIMPKDFTEQTIRDVSGRGDFKCQHCGW